MSDIWGFCLQTLTASGVALMLLLIKAIFRDKLPPKWQFAVWSVLGILLLVPAGFHGRYTLFHWQLVIEVVKGWCGDFSVTRVLFPVPVLTAVPRSVTDWLFAAYVLGVAVHILAYAVSYIRLRQLLRNSEAPSTDTAAHIHRVAEGLHIQPCRIIAVPALPSAFVCGVIRPILVIPADGVIDDKILLHELLHLKNRDTLWSAVICLLRCIHWCNPLLVYCADRALCDMEARCDQHVLEQLEGEERRDYGRILLSMANERFAKTPASTCINNGGKHIRRRIEAIARFKNYPVGMGLVSVCIILVLTCSLVVGAQATTVYEWNSSSMWLPLASARSTPCTTAAGALDTYAKAVLDQNGIYRVMCAPASMQEELQREITENERMGIYPHWDSGLNEWPNAQSGYYLYDLTPCGKTAYEALFVIELSYPPNGAAEEEGRMYLAVQRLRAEKENGRWVAIPLEEFRNVEAAEQDLQWGCTELAGTVYTGTAADFRVEVTVQTVHTVDNTVQSENNSHIILGSDPYLTMIPKPHAQFDMSTKNHSTSCTHLGTQSERDAITQVGLSVAPVYANEERPHELALPTGADGSSSNNHGEAWRSLKTEPGWGPTLHMSGGGSSYMPAEVLELPVCYAADLYVNNELVAQLDLHPQEVTQG